MVNMAIEQEKFARNRKNMPSVGMHLRFACGIIGHSCWSNDESCQFSRKGLSPEEMG